MPNWPFALVGCAVIATHFIVTQAMPVIRLDQKPDSERVLQGLWFAHATEWFALYLFDSWL